MTNEINIEDIWWVYIYLVPNFLTTEGKIISSILEYGGIIINKRKLYEKLKENKINITYPTFHETIKRLTLKGFLIKEIINKKGFLTINKKCVEEAKLFKERILLRE